jgi:hypothetical protein
MSQDSLFSYSKFCEREQDGSINPTDLLPHHKRGCPANQGRACNCDLFESRSLVDRILRRQESIEDSLRWLVDWREKAYPEDIFPEPSADDLKKADELLRAGGLSLDVLSASNIRFALSRVLETLGKAIGEEEAS